MIDYKYFTADDGEQIAYVVIGEGKPLIYFHGMGSTIESQMPLLEMLKDQFKIVMFDQRTFGKTETTKNVGIPQSARDGHALLEHLGIEKAVFLGYSMGACDIFSYLQQFGCEKMEKIIFTDMSPKLICEDGWELGLYQGQYSREMYENDLQLMKTGKYKQFALLLAEGLLFHQSPETPRDFSGDEDTIRQRIQDRKPPYPLIAEVLINGLVDITPEHMVSNLAYWETMAGVDYRDVFEKVTVPSLFVAARPGSGYAPETAQWMHEHTAGSQLKWIDGCGHMCGAENRPLWVSYLKEFGA